MTTLLRRELGDVLRERRRAQGRTLREISATASVSLGYLSEVERGEKEASSELLASICGALELPLSSVLIDVSTRMAESEGLAPPVKLPARGRRRRRLRLGRLTPRPRDALTGPSLPSTSASRPLGSDGGRVSVWLGDLAGQASLRVGGRAATTRRRR